MLYNTHLLRHLRFTIGQNIHHLRAKQKMPLGLLSKLTDIPREKLDCYEIGKNEITVEHILRIACTLDARPESLLKL